MPKKPDEKRLPPIIDEEVEDGTYSNVAQVVFSPAEFVVDFGRMVPGRKQVKTLSRIILTPAHAKQLAAALNENVRRYEEQFGEIPAPGASQPGMEMDPTGGFKQ
ncbi:MAG: DUF3467 domain-containing protein [bacterium]|nr:DUF3467 domain-containing protein [bacterium]